MNKLWNQIDRSQCRASTWWSKDWWGSYEHETILFNWNSIERSLADIPSPEWRWIDDWTHEWIRTRKKSMAKTNVKYDAVTFGWELIAINFGFNYDSKLNFINLNWMFQTSLLTPKFDDDKGLKNENMQIRWPSRIKVFLNFSVCSVSNSGASRQNRCVCVCVFHPCSVINKIQVTTSVVDWYRDSVTNSSQSHGATASKPKPP